MGIDMSSADYGFGIAIQGNGRIVIVGKMTVPGDSVVIRLLSDGSRDSSFGTNGVLVHP
ncbi:MAG: hypothetical protein U1D30_13925 [Planctomycetota bacterium]